MNYDPLLSISEVCARLNAKRSKVYVLLKDQRMRAVKVGCSTLIYEFQRFLASCPPAEFRPNAVRVSA
jgi:excisionase family DNA binding protein